MFSNICYFFEVLEEVRRSLSQPEEEDVGHYLKTCVENLKIKLDHLIYYGISKSALRPPTNISDGRIVKVQLVAVRIRCLPRNV